MPRTTLSDPGYHALTEHDSQAAWVSFLNIGLHPRENQETKDAFQSILVSGETRLFLCNNNAQTYGHDMGGRSTPINKLHAPYPFNIILVGSSVDRAQSVQLSFDNVDRSLTDTLRRAEYPISIHFGLGMVLRTEYDAGGHTATAYADEGFEVYLNGLELVSVSWNETSIAGTLVFDSVLNKAFPSNHPLYEHVNFPGLFGLCTECAG